MYKTVKIGDVNVPMAATAVVDYLYKAIFRADPIVKQDSGMSPAEAIEFYIEMGFVMAKFAEVGSYKEMKNLSEDDFMDWLVQFGRGDLIFAVPEIQKVYDGQNEAVAEEKKREGEPSVE